MTKKITAIIIIALLAGCSPHVVQKSGDQTAPVLLPDQAIMPDGYRLPLLETVAGPAAPLAIVLALHGMNDYSNAFRPLKSYLASRNILLAAYDQRGFGRTDGRGLWHGINALTADLAAMCRLIHEKYPGTPLFIMGESMGGAVILSAQDTLQQHAEYEGIILIAPAVWSKETMPWYQQYLLRFFAHTLPWLPVSADGLDITPSDNTEMLRALGEDPLVIKETRIDTLYGISNLMDKALVSSQTLNVTTLLLYGEHDEIIPGKPVCRLLKTLQGNRNLVWRFILYADGYHMLTRDLQAENVYLDIEQWIVDAVDQKDLGHNGVQAEDLESVCTP